MDGGQVVARAVRCRDSERSIPMDKTTLRKVKELQRDAKQVFEQLL